MIAVKKPKRNQETCRCPAYEFPHRKGSGRCHVKFLDEPICSCCLENCEVIRVDYGIGPYEFWGHRRVHHDWGAGSACCKEPLIDPKTGKDLQDWQVSSWLDAA